MSIPSHPQIMKSILKVLSDKEDMPKEIIEQRIASDLNLNDGDLSETCKGGSNRFKNRVYWARKYLSEALLLQSTEKGIYKLTDRGLKAYKDNPENMYDYLRQFEEYRRFREPKNKKSSQNVKTKQNERDVLASDPVLKESDWSKEETILAFFGYKLTPLDKQDPSNPEIQKLARLINHTPESIKDKFSFFASLDTPMTKNISGAENLLGKEILNKYSNNTEQLFSDTKEALTRLKKIKNIDEYPKMLIGIDTEDTEQIVNVKMRKHQQQFRAFILSIYDYRCCITGFRTLDLLEAAHIVAWSEYKEYRLKGNNGLCINSMFHKAYDKYMVSITPDYTFKVNMDMIEHDDRLLLEIFMHDHGKKIYLPDERYKPDK